MKILEKEIISKAKVNAEVTEKESVSYWIE